MCNSSHSELDTCRCEYSRGWGCKDGQRNYIMCYKWHDFWALCGVLQTQCYEALKAECMRSLRPNSWALCCRTNWKSVSSRIEVEELQYQQCWCSEHIQITRAQHQSGKACLIREQWTIRGWQWGSRLWLGGCWMWTQHSKNWICIVVKSQIKKQNITELTRNTWHVTLDIQPSKLIISSAVSFLQQTTTTLSSTVSVLGVGTMKTDRGTLWCVIGDTVPTPRPSNPPL